MLLNSNFVGIACCVASTRTMRLTWTTTLGSAEAGRSLRGNPALIEPAGSRPNRHGRARTGGVAPT